jgi:hypothetical protein
MSWYFFLSNIINLQISTFFLVSHTAQWLGDRLGNRITVRFPAEAETFSFLFGVQTSSWGPTQLHAQRVLGQMWMRHKYDHPPPPTVKAKTIQNYTPSIYMVSAFIHEWLDTINVLSLTTPQQLQYYSHIYCSWFQWDHEIYSVEQC